MLKQQLLKKYKILNNKPFYAVMLVLAFGLCVNITAIICYVSRASDLAAIENLTLWDLTKIDMERDYKGTTVKALEYFLKAFMNFLTCIVLTMVLCSTPYIQRKRKQILKLINQLPDEI